MTKIQTEFGRIEIEGGAWRTYFSLGNVQVEIEAPDVEDPDEISGDVTLSIRETYITQSEALDLVKLLEWASGIAEQIQKANAPMKKLAEQREREREKEEQRQREEREAVLAERRERLMEEFMGETVKVRERGYKTARVATVYAEQLEHYDYDKRAYVKDEKYTLRFRYRGEARTQNISQMMRLDIKVGSEWQTLWDDGTDDVWGELATSAKPTGKMYDEMGERL